MFDGKGLFLLVKPSGSKLWHFKYRYEGKANLLSFGTYSEISLTEARNRRDEARKNIAHGVDPASVRKKRSVFSR